MKQFFFKLFIAVLLLTTSSIGFAQNFPTQVADKLLYDEAKLLTEEQRQVLQDSLRLFRDSSTHKLVVVTVNDMEGLEIEEYSNKLFNTWKIGNEKYDNGVLLLIAKTERKIRIEVGYGLEQVLTDANSKRIINDYITPKFKEGKPYEGISDGVEEIKNVLLGRNSLETNKEDFIKEDSPSLPENEFEKSFWFSTAWNYYYPTLMVLLILIVIAIYMAPKSKYNTDMISSAYVYSLIGALGIYVFYVIWDAIQIFGFMNMSSDDSWTQIIAMFVLRIFLIAAAYGTGALVAIPILIILAKWVYKLPSNIQNNTSSSSSKTYRSSTRSSSSSYSDYSDKSYSDYSDYSDKSYSDYSDYSDAGGSSGGGGASGGW